MHKSEPLTPMTRQKPALTMKRAAPPLLLALAIALAALGSSAAPVRSQGAIVVDGNTGDWAGIPELLTDPAGDAPAGAIDFRSLKVTDDGANVFLLYTFDWEPVTVTGSLLVNTDRNPITGCTGAEFVIQLSFIQQPPLLQKEDHRFCPPTVSPPRVLNSVAFHPSGGVVEASYSIQGVSALTPGGAAFDITSLDDTSTVATHTLTRPPPTLTPAPLPPGGGPGPAPTSTAAPLPQTGPGPAATAPPNAVTPDDSDGDGVPSAADLCPVSAGTVDANGCADLEVDSDLDGVCNSATVPSRGPSSCSGADLCPVSAGTVDANGCADYQLGGSAPPSPAALAATRPPGYASDRQPQVVRAVPGPDQISLDPDVIGSNVVLALFVVFSFAFTSTLFNQTLDENRRDIEGWAGPLLAPLRRLAALAQEWFAAVGGLSRIRRISVGRSWAERLAGPALILSLTGLIYGFLSPDFGLNTPSLILFASLMIGVGAITYLY